MVLPDSLATVSLVAPLRPLCVCVIGLVRLSILVCFGLWSCSKRTLSSAGSIANTLPLAVCS